MEFSKRPTRGETDEDLLKLQEEFLKNKLKPSVTVVKCERKEDKQCVDELYVNAGLTKTPNEDIQHSQDTSSDRAKKNVSWLGDTAMAKATAIGNVVVSSNTTIPSDGIKTSGVPHRRAKSLFALRMEQSRLKTANESSSTNLVTSPVKVNIVKEVASESVQQPCQKKHLSPDSFGDHSYILCGPESLQIHEENVARLSSMSEEEIKLERERLISQLSPSTLSFLASRRKKAQDQKEPLPAKSETSAPQAKPSKKHSKFFGKSVARTLTAESDVLTDVDELSGLPINPTEAKQWLHMDVVEKEKLQWMKDIPPVDKMPGPDELYAARFDFEGNLLPYIDPSVEVNRGLHNHGDEPTRPGYTLQELLQFTRSAVLQQRVLGLTALGNVIQKTKLAKYDRIVEQKLLRQLLDAGIFLLLRFSMDDPVASVATAATTAMCNLLFNSADEACLDYVLGCEGGTIQPTLQVVNQSRNKNKEDEEEELKDYELIQLDVMKGALRTNLVLRLGYLLDVVRITPGPILDILTVLCRHSPETARAVIDCSGMLSTIRQELMGTRISESPNPGYGEPCSKAIRLFRVLIARSRSFAVSAVEKFAIMDSIMAYISMSSSLPGSNIQGLVIGAFYLWQSLLSYGLCAQALSELHPILMRQLHFHAQLTSVVGDDAASPGHELATALVGVIEKALLLPDVDVPSSLGLLSLVIDCAQKWLTQMTTFGNTVKAFSWSGVKMMGAVFRCLAIALDLFWNDEYQGSRQFRNKLKNLIENFLVVFMRSGALKTLTANLKKSSHLLSKSESGSKRDAPNLPSLASIDWGEEIVPAGLRDYSPLPLIGGLTQFVAVMHTHSIDSSRECVSRLLMDNSLVSYLRDISTTSLRGSGHWFARQELYVLYHLISLINAARETALPDLANIFGRLVLRVCGLIHNEDRFLLPGIFKHCIFDEKSLVWRNLSNLDHIEMLRRIFKRLPLIYNVYLHVLCLRSCSPPNPLTRSSLMASHEGAESVLPIDWPFAPIMLLYGNSTPQEGGGSSSDGSEDAVVACLEFLFLSEVHWPNPWLSLSATAFWCRLSLIFLCGSDFFLSPSTQRLLRANQQTLLRRYKNIDFREDIPGLSSFYELYQELLLQFCAISYGDNLFGAFILFPLQQRYDTQYRRLLWTEYPSVLRFLRTNEEEVGVPVEEFLNPVESDESVLAAYLQYLASDCVKNQLLSKIASNHVRAFVKQRKENNFAQKLHDSLLKINNPALHHQLLS